MPLSGVILPTGPQPERGNAGDGGFVTAPATATAAVPTSISRKRRRGAKNAPPVRQRGGVSNVSPLGRHSGLSRSSSRFHAKDAPAPPAVDASTSGAGGGALWGVRRLGLPPLEERYPNAKDGWVHSPVALRLERPRCKSVDIAHLNQPAYKEYMKRVLHVGAAATWQDRQKPVDAQVQGRAQKGGKVGRGLTNSRQRDRMAGRSSRASSNCLPVHEDAVHTGGGGGCDGRGEEGHGVSFLSSASQTSVPGGEQMKKMGGPRSIGRSSTATAAAATFLASGDDRRRADENGSLDGCGVNIGQDPSRPAKATPALLRALSRFQLREAGQGVFRLTSCDTEEAATLTANDGEGGASPAMARRDALSQHPLFGSDHDDSGSAASTTDDALASEALRLRSKGARKVFKQTQRLLGALRTPASSCQTTSTGSRRGCGGGSMGGHSSVVVHYRGGPSDSGNGGGSVGSDPNLINYPGRDDEVWRVARGTRLARLAEVFRCIVPPHTVRIECEILLHESLSRTGGGRDWDVGAGGAHSGTWDDFVFAWEVSWHRLCARHTIEGALRLAP